MKKSGLIFVTLLVSIVLLSGFYFVSAADTVYSSSSSSPLVSLIQSFINGVAEVLRPVLQYLIGDYGGTASFSTSDLFISKILLMILVFAVTFEVIKQIPGLNSQTWTSWVVGIVVSILSIRFLGPDLVQTILLPYSTFGVAVTAIIPFVIYFFFVSDFQSSIARRVAWIFFAVLFLGLYVMRVDELGNVAWIYPATALAAFIMLVMDGTIRRIRTRMRTQRSISEADYRIIRSLQSEMADVERAYRENPAGYMGTTQRARALRGNNAYREDMRWFREEIARLSTP